MNEEGRNVFVKEISEWDQVKGLGKRGREEKLTA